MSMMTLSQAHTLLGTGLGAHATARLLGDGNTELHRVHTDTRTVRQGDLFVALKGERFDAHDFLAQARTAGASAVVGSRGDFDTGIVVDDTQLALEALGAAWRQRFHLPLIAVTGSNGKTTVTQMIASILRAWLGEGALWTEGNFNNHIGVPLTLLRLRQDDERWHRAAVVELGMNHVGEIARLAAMAKPTVALVNNAQREHQEFMDGVQAVARENANVFDALPASGVAIFPADDAHSALWRDRAQGRKCLTFGVSAKADFQVQGQATSEGWHVELHTPGGPLSTALHLPGEHMLHNAAAAAACAVAAGAPLSAVAEGLAEFKAVKGRLVRQELTLHGRRVTLIDDSYNANPDSVLAAINVLARMPAPRWLVLGDMGEVGASGPAFHSEVGRHAQAQGIEHLWTAGELTAHTQGAFGDHPSSRHAVDVQALVQSLGSGLAHAPKASSVLVKGSRFMAMERFVKALGESASGSVLESAGQSQGGRHAH
jgi:UDP-N-acetylmuramoyl-tripeptide--D-alanyl-D-alanine ligase